MRGLEHLKRLSLIPVILGLIGGLSSPSQALFDTGTAMERGKLEIDAAINPFEQLTYGQNFVFLHYGLGNGYEVHGYFSKWGTITNWNASTTEIYGGVLKQWAHWEFVDLATSVGIRKVLKDNVNASLIGPGVLYTWRVRPAVRIAGHFQYIGDIGTRNGLSLSALNQGFTHEVGFYYMIAPGFELAAGIFTNSQGIPRPIYTLNFYL